LGSISVVTTIRQAVGLIGRDNRGRWLILVLFALVSSGFEVVGAALIYVLLALIAEPEAGVSLPVLGDISARFDVSSDALLLGLAATMAAFFVLRAAVHVAEVYLQNRVASNAGARLASRLFRGYLSMPYVFHLGRPSSELIRNGHQAVTELVNLVFVPLIRVVAETIMVAGMLILLVTLAPVATALAVVVVGGAAVLLLKVVQPRLSRLGERGHALDARSLSILQQSLHGIRDIKILDQERAFVRRYEMARLGLARVTYLRATATELPKTVMELALLGFIIMVFAGSVAFGDGTDRTLSVLGLFAYAGLRLQPSLQRIIAGMNNLKYASRPISDLTADLSLIAQVDLTDSPTSRLPFESELRLENVRFRYEGGHGDALVDINLSVKPGEVVGICGPTGGGKTTLVDVVSGLLQPDSGAVTVDGVDLRGRERAWQSNLGVVPQMVFLTDETLRENIALGVSPELIDEEAVKEAAELSQLTDYIRSLPLGLDTVVGERGVRISGGQRQRVAIARALYRRPEVLLFDEGTSALDNSTERELMAALDRLRGRCTVLLIAHRLTTVRDADQIVFMEAGRINGRGTYQELMQSNASFQQLAASSS
jgi:ATP-binding cassette, subfamily B, bacterial PglK